MPTADPDRAAPPDAGALDAAMRKRAVVWLSVAGQRPCLVWPLWHDRTLYVLHGGAEQSAPGLAEAARGALAVTVAVPSAGARELLLEWTATARDVPAGGVEWLRIVPLLLPKRLNLREPATAVERWARDCAITALTPAA